MKLPPGGELFNDIMIAVWYKLFRKDDEYDKCWRTQKIIGANNKARKKQRQLFRRLELFFFNRLQ